MGPPSRQPSHRGDVPGQRPSAPQRVDTFHSRYVEMLLNQDDIPQFHTILAALSVWLLLAGFLVFPGTFTSIGESIQEREDDGFAGLAADEILNQAQNIPLLVIASVTCGIAILGMLYLATQHRKNYVWLLNRLLLPGATNGLAGLISTLIGVYTQQDGNWNVTAIVTASVEVGCVVICGLLFLIIQQILLRAVKKAHGRHYESPAGNRESEEGFVEKMGRKTKEPALAPGSVV
ncbi:hypothetical protein S40285_03803 [Stachybotrys chlorohalonatus IBT 40285]|uniref:Uncharacterized protein n=1 Tax=Stachybotrys chlorohalonatus (strain IBT 40285) TaxID=1283841 RepID=A0A084QFP8_STAC4|nr:hypothetical protein S40285_03803 [Stachybotrys chlorohalonata IBT 40285]